MSEERGHAILNDLVHAAAEAMAASADPERWALTEPEIRKGIIAALALRANLAEAIAGVLDRHEVGEMEEAS